MTDRPEIERLLGKLYEARVGARLEPLCALFAADARFRIAGTSDGKPIAITAAGIDQIRSWLSMLVRSFGMSHHELLSMVIDGQSAAVHWRTRIHSKITGSVVQTELVDLVEIGAGRITSYTEFFVPY